MKHGISACHQVPDAHMRQQKCSARAEVCGDCQDSEEESERVDQRDERDAGKCRNMLQSYLIYS